MECQKTRLGNGEVVIVSSELWRIPVGLVAESDLDSPAGNEDL